MDLIKTGIEITKTMKNVGRLKEIVTVFAKNGFKELIQKTGIHNKIPDFVLPESGKLPEASEESREEKIWEGEQIPWSKTIGFRLRNSFEELGPTFIKLGQLLSTREDMFDPLFTEEMKKLLDQAKPIPFEDSKKIIEDSLGISTNKIFKNIENAPIGTASIGIVYKGELLSGEKVVIKIRRANIEKIVKTDAAILRFLAEKIESVSIEVKQLGVSKLISDFTNNLLNELDFNLEYLNAERLRANITKLDTEKIFHLPKMYKEFCKENVLVMEFLDGIPFTSKEIQQHKHIIEPKVTKGLEIFVDCLLQDGFFHADLHQGNFFLLRNHQIGVIDFGLVGSLGKKGRNTLISILYALTTFNFENLTYEFLEVAEFESIPDIDLLTQDIKRCVDPFIGLTIKQMNYGKIFSSITKTLTAHKIYLPREWFIVFRAMVLLEGVGRSLNLDYDIFSLISSNITNKVKNIFSNEEMLEDGLWGLRDVFTLTRIFPRHLRWFLKEFSKNNYALELKVKGPEKELHKIANALIFLGYTLMSSILVFGGIFSIKKSADGLESIPKISILFWVFAIILFWRGSNIINRRKHD